MHLNEMCCFKLSLTKSSASNTVNTEIRLCVILWSLARDFIIMDNSKTANTKNYPRSLARGDC